MTPYFFQLFVFPVRCLLHDVKVGTTRVEPRVFTFLEVDCMFLLADCKMLQEDTVYLSGYFFL